MAHVQIAFGIRAYQEGLPGYESAWVGYYHFSFEVDGQITTKEDALIAAAFFRNKFLEESRKKGISSGLQVLPEEEKTCYIPTCYLDNCEYAVVDGKRLYK